MGDDGVGAELECGDEAVGLGTQLGAATPEGYSLCLDPSARADSESFATMDHSLGEERLVLPPLDRGAPEDPTTGAQFCRDLTPVQREYSQPEINELRISVTTSLIKDAPAP